MDDSKILILGANGQLGKALSKKYPNAVTIDIDSLDITDAEELDRYDWSRTKIILNAAAFTNVDGSETKEGRITAWKVNALAPKLLAGIAIQKDITIVHISSDYVFDGTIINHKEDELFSPLSVYGSSKAAGDIAISLVPNHYILRTSWVIGDGKNFIRTMLELGNKGINPTVVSDQFGRLTFTSELVSVIDFLLNSHAQPGTYNVSNDGLVVSWAEITREIYKIAGLKNSVSDITTKDYSIDKEFIAPRPLQSSLDLGKLKSIGFKFTDWEKELTNYIEKENS